MNQGVPAMRFRLGWTAALVAFTLLAVNPARAVDYAAAGSGNWSTAATWTPSGVPGAADNASIGTSTVTTATVTLTADAAISNLYIGDSGSTSGTLALGGFNLTAGTIYLGWYGPTGASIIRSAVRRSRRRTSTSRTAIATISGLRTPSRTSPQRATATTAATGNITGNVDVNNNNWPPAPPPHSPSARR